MKKPIICGVYQIINKVTGERYIGSSSNIRKRWQEHKRLSYRLAHPCLLYQKFEEYGLENFSFQYLAFVEKPYVKLVEQELIDLLNPEYNKFRAHGQNYAQYLEYRKKWNKEHYNRKK